MESSWKNQKEGRDRSIWALFFCSGVLGLIYEVIWHRQFSAAFGSAAAAGAVTLAAYFAGLGIGSVMFGRVARKYTNPLRVYGVLELAVGLGALATAPILRALESGFAQAVSGPGTVLAWKGAAAFAAIAGPTIAMGGTLPILAGLAGGRGEGPGERIGWLYFLNTGGAAIGALMFPFVLLPALGTAGSTYLCAAANCLIGAIAIWLGQREARVQGAPVERQTRKVFAPMAVAFISGAGTFALQVLWNRAFGLIHENSIFSFALIAAVFIAALAMGAELARIALRRQMEVRRCLGGLWAAGGLAAMASPFLFVRLSNGLEFLPTAAHGFSPRLLAIALLAMVLPVALLGTAMPLLFEEGARKAGSGNATGMVLGANITGAIAGALLAGFVLPQWLGLWNGIIAVGVVFVLAGGTIAGRGGLARASFACGGAMAGWLFAQVDLPRTRLDTRAGERLVAITEGAHGVVAVTERGNSRRLKLNNHYVLGGTSAVGDERMQAHIPLLLHRAPQEAAFLGYGSGITAGGATFHPGLHAEGIELVPEVASFAAKYFDEANASFGRNGRSRVVVEDARYFLRRSGRKYDAVIGDLVVPWRPGESSLYTLEHFQSAKEALKSNGVFCVWIPAFQVNEAQFQIVVNTFLAVFEEGWVWRGDFSPREPAIALVAFAEGGMDAAGVRERLGAMAVDPFNPQLKQQRAFWLHLVGRVTRGGVRWAERRVNYEDLPWLELRGRAATGENSEEFFVGRKLQRWVQQIREESRLVVEGFKNPEMLAGWSAGEPMFEFTLLLNEGRSGEAQVAQAKARQTLGEEAGKAIFGQ